MTVARFIYFSLSAVPANATLLMISRCVTTTMMIGLPMPQTVRNCRKISAQIAQDISSRLQEKKRRRSGLRRGFLSCKIGEIDRQDVSLIFLQFLSVLFVGVNLITHTKN